MRFKGISLKTIFAMTLYQGTLEQSFIRLLKGVLFSIDKQEQYLLRLVPYLY